MSAPGGVVALRIYLNETDRHHHLPLYEAIVLKAREMHLNGATVLRGQIGFGSSKKIHGAAGLRIAQDMPIIIEIVDTEDRLRPFLAVLDEMMSGGLVTLTAVDVAGARPQREARPASS